MKEKELRKNIGKNIRIRRLALNLTQKELADRCGYADNTTITKIEKGHIDVTLGRLSQIAEALDTSVYSLIYDNPNDSEINRELLKMDDNKFNRLLSYAKFLNQEN